jgi:hypothetical protein
MLALYFFHRRASVEATGWPQAGVQTMFVKHTQQARRVMFTLAVAVRLYRRLKMPCLFCHGPVMPFKNAMPFLRQTAQWRALS